MSLQSTPLRRVSIRYVFFACILIAIFVYPNIFPVPASPESNTSISCRSTDPIRVKQASSSHNGHTFDILPHEGRYCGDEWYPNYWECKWMVDKVLAFDGSEFNEQNGYVGDHLWNFGDNITASGAVVSHAYKEAGDYTVTLTVTDNGDSICVITRAINILPKPPTTIYVSQPGEYEVGDIIIIGIMISYVTDLYAWQSGMTYNSTVLECITTANDNPITIEMIRYLVENGSDFQISPDEIFDETALREGEFLKRGGQTIWFPGNLVEGPFARTGKITAHGSCLVGMVPRVSGSGILATAVFRVIGEGDLNIHLTDVLLVPRGDVAFGAIPVFVAT